MEPSQHRAAKAHVIKILDGLTLADFWQVVREAGYPLRPMLSEQWWTAMRENALRQGEKHCLWPLMWMLEDNRHGGLASNREDHGGVDRDLMRSSRVKAAVGRNLAWLREKKAFPGF